MSQVFRNQRFKRGNKLTLYYNPYIIVDTGYFNPTITSYINYDVVDYYYTGLEYPSLGDIITCSSFGGDALASTTGSYGSEYKAIAYEVGKASLIVPKDCFNGDNQLYIDDYKDKIYTFKDDSSYVEDVFISEYITSTNYGKYGSYPINYRMNDDNRIKVIVPDSNFDVLCQIMMSKAVAVKSCDRTYDQYPDIPNGMNEIHPYGGGSFNPVIRQGVIITDNIKKVRGINSYEIEIKLLG